MSILLPFIPTLWEFVLLLFTMFFVIFFTPTFQYNIMRFESFMIYPFVCTKCCSFWMCMILNVFYAYIFNPYFILWGLLCSSTLAYMHIYSAKH